MQKFKEFFINSFFCYLAIELVEEMLEEALAVGISNIIIKGASTLLVVSLTQSFKVVPTCSYQLIPWRHTRS